MSNDEIEFTCIDCGETKTKQFGDSELTPSRCVSCVLDHMAGDRV